MVHTNWNATYIFVLTAGGAIWVKLLACVCKHSRFVQKYESSVEGKVLLRNSQIEVWHGLAMSITAHPLPKIIYIRI